MTRQGFAPGFLASGVGLVVPRRTQEAVQVQSDNDNDGRHGDGRHGDGRHGDGGDNDGLPDPGSCAGAERLQTVCIKSKDGFGSPARSLSKR